MSYAAVREQPSPSASPEPAVDEGQLDEDPDTDNIHQQHLPSYRSAHAAAGRLPLDPSKFAPDSEALQAEAELEEKHEAAVDEQLDGEAVSSAVSPPSILTDTASLEEGAKVLPEPSPATLAADAENIMGKPSEMSAEELRSHMADVAERVAADVKEMEERKQQAPARDAIVINPGRHDRLIRTLFGFTVHCKCTINDEVRMTVWILLIVGSLAGFGFFVADVRSTSFDTGSLRLHERVVAISIGGVFAFLATVLSIIQIRAHYRNWVHPPSQRCVVRILMMVPVYSISAWLSLVFLQYSLYIDFVRMCYEAFVIYTFMILLTKYLGGHNGVVEWMKTKQPLPWPSPLCCAPPVKPGHTFLYWLKYGTLQYTIISPVISIIAMVLNFFGYYGDGDMDFTRGYVYITFVQNITQLTSLYCLVWLYVAMKNELAPFSPMAKFLVVKSVVFFTFWQAVGLAVLVKMSILTSTADLDVGEIQVGLQDFIVCIEMFIAAAVHKYTFGWETYANGTMKLLMDQRAMYLAEMSYKRAQEEQKKEEARLLREERHRQGIYTDDDNDETVGEDGEPKKKRKRRRKRKGKGSKRHTIDTSHVTGGGEVAIDISPGPGGPAPANMPRTPVLDPTRFTGEDDGDDALVDDAELTKSQQTRRYFAAPPSLTLHSPVSASSTASSSATAPRTSITKPHPFSHFKRPSLNGQSAFNLLQSSSRSLISGTKSIMAPVSSFFVNADDDALFDDDESGAKPVLLTAEMRRDIEEKVRREKEVRDRRKAQRSSGGGGGGGGDYQHVSSNDRADELEMQETKEREADELQGDEDDVGHEAVGDEEKGYRRGHTLIASRAKDEDETL